MVLSWYVLEIVMALSIFKVSTEKHTAPIVRATTGQRGTFVQTVEPARAVSVKTLAAREGQSV
jgi:hypothetical protein